MTSFVLGGGCFWCLDAVFRNLKGVQSSECGYAGGTDPMPNYYRVATGKTGHAEVVQIVFDENIIPRETILDIFFLIHNPTTLNRQGADVGTEYRSLMLYKNLSQKEQFEVAMQRAQKVWDEPIVTELSEFDKFYVAEDEHQDYFAKNPEVGYCQIVIEPKVTKARKKFAIWFQ
jgi:peptide-methionine (S)-S-oxide reductase